MREDFTTIEIRQLSPALGAEIHGVDLSRPVGAAQFPGIRRACHVYGLIV
ncbi:MAG: taurine dioxygenase, partial [Proteobacteria bacterium]|nr:taurine dioxygenase [Pseudomonadota bacterium]